MKNKIKTKVKKNKSTLEIDKNLKQGLHFYHSDEYDKAQLFLEKVLSLDPLNFKAIFISSVIAYKTKNYSLAAELGLIGLTLDPENNQIRKHYSYVMKELRLFDRAHDAISKAIESEPEDASFYKCRANLYEDQEQFQDAKREYQKSISLNSNDETAFNGLGTVCAALKEYSLAIDSYQKAIVLKPDYAYAYSNMALTYQLQHNYEIAKDMVRRAITIDSSNEIFYINLSSIESDNNEKDSALKNLQIALSIKPNDPDAMYNSGLLYLSRYDFENGWKGYDYRWQVKSFNSKRFEFSKPVIEFGQTAENLLIYGEQGIGDQILYCSMLSKVNSLAKYTTVLLEKRLLPLLQRSFPDIRFIEKIEEDIVFDKYIALGSIGKFFLKEQSDFDKFERSYLVADHERSESLRQAIGANKKLICGISWRSKAGKHGANKSLELEELLPLFRLSNIQFVNLQYGNVKSELDELERKHGIKIFQCDSVDNMQDIDGLASLIDACDFVVTSSNTATHLVGGLNRPCYLMTPSNAGSLWYWDNVKDGKSLWYPSIQIFKQPALNEWARSIDLIVDDIRDRYLT